jgi:tRNA isopentenyl-2-thiomethyl-A-37 hydroxylase MiaE
MTSLEMESAIRNIQDALVVMAHIEKRQTERLQDLLLFRDRAEDLEVKGAQWRARADERMAHLTETLAEVGDKLNGLIGYVQGQKDGA